jgi:hypothetical protein
MDGAAAAYYCGGEWDPSSSMNGQLDCLLPTVQETGARLLLAFFLQLR